MPDYKDNTPNDISSRSEKSISKKGIIIAVCIIAGIAMVGSGIFFGIRYFNNDPGGNNNSAITENQETFYNGISVQGVSLGGMTKEQAKEALKPAEEKLREGYGLTLTYGGDSWNLTADDLVFAYNTEEVLNEAYQYGRSGTEEENQSQIKALESEPKTWELTCSLDTEAVKSRLDEVADGIDSDPVNATVVNFDPETASFSYDDGKDGVKVNRDQLYEEALAVLNGEKSGTVEIPAETIPFDVTEAHLKNRMQEIGAYETVSTNTADGNHNMQLGMDAINGVILEPGETFSFNNTTGDTTTGALGYRKAVAISGGKKVMEYGGGICQVSTTLYGAALRANMEIVERSNHMWPSTYCPIGLDATVSYNQLDFKFRNPTDYPVYIVAKMTGVNLKVTLYGYQSPDYDTVEIKSWQTGTIPQIADKYEVDQSLKKDEVKLLMKGNPGRTASAQRIFSKNGKVVKTEDLPSSKYRPVATIYNVGPGTDTSQIVNGSIPSTAPPSSSEPESSVPPVSSEPESSLPESSAPESSTPESSTPENGLPVYDPADGASDSSQEPDQVDPGENMPLDDITPTP